MALIQEAFQLILDIAVQMALRIVTDGLLKNALIREFQALRRFINRRNRVQ